MKIDHPSRFPEPWPSVRTLAPLAPLWRWEIAVPTVVCIPDAPKGERMIW